MYSRYAFNIHMSSWNLRKTSGYAEFPPWKQCRFGPAVPPLRVPPGVVQPLDAGCTLIYDILSALLAHDHAFVLPAPSRLSRISWPCLFPAGMITNILRIAVFLLSTLQDRSFFNAARLFWSRHPAFKLLASFLIPSTSQST